MFFLSLEALALFKYLFAVQLERTASNTLATPNLSLGPFRRLRGLVPILRLGNEALVLFICKFVCL